MKNMNRIMAVALSLSVSGAALAQLDAGTWPTFRGNAERTGSVTAPGPAIELAWTMGTEFYAGSVSSGGFAIAANGDVYYKTCDGDGDPGVDGPNYVIRIDSQTGEILARSADIGGQGFNYGGVTIGVDRVYTVTNGSPSRLFAMNKITLATEQEYVLSGAPSLRGAPLIGDVLNDAGNRNLYVADRGNSAIHAIDSVTGDVMWTYFTTVSHVFGKFGPMWLTNDGRQAMAFFGNDALGPGSAIADNGDNTFEVLWEDAGPGNFNWWGSGVMSADGSRIYVTTFNDGGTDALWAISVADGSIIWSAGGGIENHFGRPAVVGNRIYCGGHDGRVVAYEDSGASGAIVWTYADGIDEHTAISAATDQSGTTYIYASKQGNDGVGKLLVFRDDGEDFTLLLETDLDGTMGRSIFGGNGLAIGADGGVYVGSGVRDGARGQVYKFMPISECEPCDMDCDGDVDAFDIEPFLGILFGGDEPCLPCTGDADGDGDVDAFDIEPFLECLFP